MSKRKTVADKILDALRDDLRKKLDAAEALRREASVLSDSIARIEREQQQKPAGKRKPTFDREIGVRAVEDVARMARG